MEEKKSSQVDDQEKVKKDDQTQVKDAAEKAGNTASSATRTIGGLRDGLQKTKEGLGKAGENLQKALTKTKDLIKGMITAIVKLLPMISTVIIPLAIIILAIVLLVTISYLVNRKEYEHLQASVRSEFEGTAPDWGDESASTTVSGEFGKRFYFSQIDIGGPSEIAMSSAGCGPTSIAMALSELLNREISPIDIATYALHHTSSKDGSLLYTVGAGTWGALYSEVVENADFKKSIGIDENTNLKVKQSNSKEEAIQALQNGAQIVCNSRKLFSSKVRARN